MTTKPWKNISPLRDLHSLCKLFDVRPVDEFIEQCDFSHTYTHVLEEALKEGLSEEAAEEKALEAESDESAEWYTKYRNLVITEIEKEMALWHLKLVQVKRNGHETDDYRIVPVEMGKGKGWNRAAREVLETVNGVGYFYLKDLKEFRESGPYTDREIVLNHMHYLKEYSKVYGTYSVKYRVDRGLRNM